MLNLNPFNSFVMWHITEVLLLSRWLQCLF